MIEKRPRRSCSLHRRDIYGMSIKEERLARKFLALAKVLGFLLDDEEDDDQYESWLELQHVCFHKIVHLKYVTAHFVHMPIKRLDRTIDSFHDNQISEMFRFRTKIDLRHALNCFCSFCGAWDRQERYRCWLANSAAIIHNGREDFGGWCYTFMTPGITS